MSLSTNKPLKYGVAIVVIFGTLALSWFLYFQEKIGNEKTESKNETIETKVNEIKIEVDKDKKTVEPGKVIEVKNEEKPKDGKLPTAVINEIKDSQAININASSSQQLIELYYQRLAQGYLKEAYEMKKYKTMDLSVFEGWYKNLKTTKFLDFIEVAPNQYDFLVQLEYKDGTKENYRVWMQVEGNLLNTMSSNSTDEKPELRFVYGEDGDVTTLFLAQNGNKTKIDSAKKSKYEEFNNVEITYGGDYLMYWKTGLEWNTGKVYDIATKKDIHDIDTSRGLYGFTYDMKHFYNCTGSGMASGNVNISSVPSFKLEKDLAQQGYQIYSCEGYDKKTNTLKYTLSKFINGSENKHSYSYDFNNGTVNGL